MRQTTATVIAPSEVRTQAADGISVSAGNMSPAKGAAQRRSLNENSGNLDLLRALAVLLVLADHVLETIGHYYNLNFHPWDWYFGRIGVLLFFVHTSAVLMASMERSRRSGVALLKHYFIRRAFRIYPLALLVVASVLWFELPASAWGDAGTEWASNVIVSNLLLVQNLMYHPSVLGPLWSLPLEIQMYLLLPFIYFLLGFTKSMKVLTALVGLSVVAGVVQPFISDRLNVAQFMPCFLGGVVAWTLSSRGSRPHLHWIMWPAFLFVMIAFYLLMASTQATAHPPWLGWMLCLVIGLSLTRFAELPAGVIARTAHVIAKYSYGVYLFHMIALWISFGMFSDWHLIHQLTLFAMLIVFMPVTAYHLWEEPFMRLGARISNRVAAASSPPAAAVCAESGR